MGSEMCIRDRHDSLGGSGVVSVEVGVWGGVDDVEGEVVRHVIFLSCVGSLNLGQY